MTENRHKRRQRPELLFQQTEFSEPANLVSQPVQPVERGSQNLSKPSSKSHKDKKTNKYKTNSEWLRTDTNSAKDPNCCFSKLNSVNRLIWFPNQFIRLREALKICQNLSQRVRKKKKTNQVENQLRMTDNRHKRRAKDTNYCFSKLNSVNRLIWFPNQFSRLREALKICQNLPQRVRKIKNPNQVENQLQMTENRHKRHQRPELLFQQTGFSEPANLVSQPVQPIERGSQNLSEPSSKSQKNKKTNQVENQLRMTDNRHKRSQRPETGFSAN